MSEKIVGVTEAARILGCNRDMVHKKYKSLLNEGRLGEGNGVLYFCRAEVEALAEKISTFNKMKEDLKP